MNDFSQLFFSNISQDLSSGILILDLAGSVIYSNPAAKEILGTEASGNFVQMFYSYEENDQFIQLILDSVYNKNHTQEGIVPFRNEIGTYTLRIKTSYLNQNGNCVGVICMMDDITELYELKDAVRAMNEIRRLNDSLVLRNRLIYDTFGRYLSDDIVRELLDTENGLKLGGRKQEVTVLMSDLRGFTALSERMTAFDLLAMLNHYLADMTIIIQKYKGTIIEFLGDGIFAVFGAPVSDSEHASNAAAAAIEMQSAMNGINIWNRENGYPEIQMGIGVHTGNVIIGNIGSEKRTKYGAIGYAVNIAGRIESFTTGGQILISSVTHDCIGCDLQTEAKFDINVKGKNGSVHLYSITGIGGSYQVSLNSLEEQHDLIKLKAPVPISFYRYDGKTTDGVLIDGTITGISGQIIEIRTEFPLEQYDNVAFDIGEQLYAKVTGISDGSTILTFTSKPQCFDGWKNALIRKEG